MLVLFYFHSYGLNLLVPITGKGSLKNSLPPPPVQLKSKGNPPEEENHLKWTCEGILYKLCKVFQLVCPEKGKRYTKQRQSMYFVHCSIKQSLIA